MSLDDQEIRSCLRGLFPKAPKPSEAVERGEAALRELVGASFEAAPGVASIESLLSARLKADAADRDALWARFGFDVLSGDSAFGARSLKSLAAAGDFQASWAIEGARAVFETTGAPTEAIFASLLSEIGCVEEGLAALEKRAESSEARWERRALRTLKRAKS